MTTSSARHCSPRRKSDGNRGRGRRRNLRTARRLAVVVPVMLALSFAAVPLYRLFCQVTGYGGTPSTAEQAPGEILDRTVTVRLDANTAPGMPWKFRRRCAR